MGHKLSTSFVEVSLAEAVARRVVLTLIPDPHQGPHGRKLTSRLAGLTEQGHLVASMPVQGEQKVLLSVGSPVTMVFVLGEHLLQACSRVREHLEYPIPPPRRDDAIVIDAPASIQQLAKRTQPRMDSDPKLPVATDVWSWDALASGSQGPHRSGRLANWSESGLGVASDACLPFESGQHCLIRLQPPGSQQYQLYSATLRHCTRRDDGKWLAGFADVQEVQPGQAVPLIQRLAREQNS